MENGDLIIEYKEEQSVDKELDQEITNFFKTLGYKWRGSGFSFRNNVRDILFKKK